MNHPSKRTLAQDEKRNQRREMRHSRVWSEITAIAARQCGCHYRAVSVPAEGQDQTAALCDADRVKLMCREWDVYRRIPSERHGNDWPFDPPKSCLLDEMGK